MSLPRWLAVLAVMGLVCGAGGCGGKPVPVKVSGVVVWDTGEPVPNVRVLANPTKDGGDAWADTDAEGKFHLTTFRPQDGALPGEYKITIVPADQGGPWIPDEKEDPRKRALVGRPKPKSDIPPSYGNIARTPLTLVVPPREEVRIVLNKKGA
jgi:hypothetical protein